MKKLLLFLMLTLSAGIALHAQDDKDKVKKTSTMPQKVHNTFSKHKHYKGHKSKHKHNGVKHKHKVDNMHHEEKSK
jgi:hypothetical protein